MEFDDKKIKKELEYETTTYSSSNIFTSTLHQVHNTTLEAIIYLSKLASK